MTDKIEPLSNLASLEDQTSAIQTINENNTKITEAFQNTLSRDGSTPNTMLSVLDMNSNRVINLADPVDPGDGVSKGYVDDVTGGLTPELIASIAEMPELVAEAQDAADAAAQSAIEAAGWVGAAQQAPKWSVARVFTPTGDITGASPPIDGSANVSWSMTIVNNAVTASKIAPGAIVANLGYTPLGSTGGTLTGELVNNHTPTSSLNALATGFRGIPVVSLSSSRALTLDDCGKMLRHDSGSGHTLSLENSSSVPYPAGFSVIVRNVGSGTVTIARGTSVFLYKDGSSADANVSVSQWGKVLLIHEGGNVWSVGGSGLS